jgi:polypeptide N-acetylgalactosaminyltransferase
MYYRCKTQEYHENLPNTSIIVCFYNEDKHTLYRTVYSVLDRTPQNLLHEILLIDDYSDDGTQVFIHLFVEM